jgi:hypothetical protein
MLFTAMLLTFAFGVYLLRHGLRGKHRPWSRYCHWCGYNLRGLPHRRCPECGRQNLATVIPRRRGYAMITTGLVALLASVGLVLVVLLVELSSVDFNQWRSTETLIGQRNYLLLVQRARKGNLDDAHKAALVPLALADFLAADPLTRDDVSLALLVDLWSEGYLDEAQQKQLFDALVDIRLLVRPVADRSIGVPVAVEINAGDFGWMTDLAWRAYLQLPPVQETTGGPYWSGLTLRQGVSLPADGKPKPEGGTSGSDVLAGHGAVRWDALLRDVPAGPMTVAVEVIVELYSRDALLHRVTRGFQKSATVVEPPTAPGVDRVTDMKRAPVRRRIGFEQGPLSAPWSIGDWPLLIGRDASGRNIVQTTIHLSTSPVGAAFDVLVELGGVTYPAGQIIHSGTRPTRWHIQLVDVPAPTKWGTITLTPNADLARQSADVTTMWDHPVRLWLEVQPADTP